MSDAPEPHYLSTLTAFLAETRFADLPEEVVERARWVIADTIAVIGAGMQEPEMRALVKQMAAQPGETPIIGTPARTEAMIAALLNGAAGTMLELDEGNQFARGHPGIHVVPAALALGQALGASGAEVLDAIVLGYEVGARIGIASKLKMSMHPHGTWGTVGAAVTAAKLHGYAARDMTQVINVSSSLGLSTSRQTMLEGGTVRNSFSGISNSLGMLAEQLVRAGFTGERDGLATVYGKVIAEDFRPAAMLEELGSRWEIARNYFKRHACCRYNHASLDALQQILARMPDTALDPNEIERVEIDTYSLAAQLSDQDPRNMLAAKFSLPFAVATFLFHRAATVEAFRAPALHNSKIRRLAARVFVREDPTLTSMVPATRPSRARIVLRDGRTETAETFTNRGDTEDPYSARELEEKFFELAIPVWGGERSRELFAASMRFEHIENMQSFAVLLNT